VTARTTRFPPDTGTILIGSHRGTRRFARRFLIAAFIGLMSAFIAVATYAGRRLPEAPTPRPAEKVALVTSEPSKRRSFTRNVTRIAEAASAQAMAVTTPDEVTFSAPVTTAAVSISAAAQEAPRRPGGSDGLTRSDRPTQGQGRVSRSQSGAERRDGVKRLREARRGVTVERATSSARPAGLATRRQGHLASRRNPERVVYAAPPQGVSPCSLFVACF
jgi:hypothetical protein